MSTLKGDLWRGKISWLHKWSCNGEIIAFSRGHCSGGKRPDLTQLSSKSMCSPAQPQRTLLRSNIWRSWWVAIQITQPLIPVPWLQRLHLQGNSFREFGSLCCFPGSAVWGCCANMCVCLSIAAINTLSPYSRSSLISLRKNKGWKDFFRLQDAVLIQVNTSVSLVPC